MSHSIMMNNCPLSDCTSAVENADNIYNTVSLLKTATAGVKPYASSATLLSPLSTKGQSASSYTFARPAPLQLVQSHSLPSFSRHDPYSPCIIHSPWSAEESFFACYTASEEPAAEPVPAVEANKGASVKPAEVVAAAQVSTGVAAQLPSTRRSPARQPQQQTATTAHGAVDATPVGSSSSGDEPRSRAGSASSPVTPPQQQQQPTRVIRTVVGCGVDRTSGRPIPLSMKK